MRNVGDEVCLQPFRLHLLVHGLLESCGDAVAVAVDADEDGQQQGGCQEGEEALVPKKTDIEHHNQQQPGGIGQQEEQGAVEPGQGQRGGLQIALQCRQQAAAEGLLPQAVVPVAPCQREAEGKEQQVLQQKGQNARPEAEGVDDTDDFRCGVQQGGRQGVSPPEPEQKQNGQKLCRQTVNGMRPRGDGGAQGQQSRKAETEEQNAETQKTQCHHHILPVPPVACGGSGKAVSGREGGIHTDGQGIAALLIGIVGRQEGHQISRRGAETGTDFQRLGIRSQKAAEGKDAVPVHIGGIGIGGFLCAVRIGDPELQVAGPVEELTPGTVVLRKIPQHFIGKLADGGHAVGGAGGLVVRHIGPVGDPDGGIQHILRLTDTGRAAGGHLIFFIQIVAHGAGIADQRIQTVGYRCAADIRLGDHLVEVQLAVGLEDVPQVNVFEDVRDGFADQSLIALGVNEIRLAQACEDITPGGIPGENKEAHGNQHQGTEIHRCGEKLLHALSSLLCFSIL